MTIIDPTERAKEKGALAAQAGKGLADCPYKDKRQKNGKLTWSRAWRKAWHRGFLEEKIKLDRR